MAYLDHQEAYEDFKERVLTGIKQHFPVTGSVQTVELKGLEVKDLDPDSDDIRGQHAAKVTGETWASPVFATLVLKDNKTGRVIQEKKMRVAEIPRVTSRYSYIVDGQEYQVDSQWQLKPGVYTRRMANGELESRFNTPTKKEFKILFDPATKQFNMNRGKSKAIPVYPLMKALGVDDDTLERTWGKEVFEANKQSRGLQGALNKFYRSDRKNDPASHEEALSYFRDTMAQSHLDPSVTQMTLGRPVNAVDGDVMVRATKKMLQVQSGAPEDDRDSLEFKKLRTAGDYAYDKLTDWMTGRSIRARMIRKVNQAQDIREVVKFGMLNEPIKKTFKANSASRPASQINPLEMTASAQQTTIMGPGGIQSMRAIDNTISLKLVNPSHLGFLDPVKTPENEKTGVILRLPTGVKKIDGEAKVPLYNVKTGKIDYLGPTEFHQKNVVLADQVRWENGKPKPIASEVQMSTVGNKLETGKFSNADYVMRHPSQLFSLTTNLIPFLGTVSGNRATYAGFHLEQAISLKHREAPLVQVGTGVKDPHINSFEGIMGRQAGHVSLHDGVVTAVKKDSVVIRKPDGKLHEVQLYNNFPLNDPKGVLTSTPIVKVGDQVKAGQAVADTNYTKDGRLALGTNLRVAYIPFKGYNFEDGVVISRSAANKLTSEHLYKESTRIADDVVRDVRKFRNQHQGVFNDEQYKKLDEKGVVKVGQRVMPGDPLVISMTPFKIKDRLGISAVRKSLSGHHTDSSLRWKSDYPGEVVATYERPDGTVGVHVRTEEPMQVGDKITGRFGNKGICTLILDDDKMPKTKDGKHIEVALNPSGVPGRMNVGQVLETAAAKIALKTGKPYIVNNFDGSNFTEKVKADLKAHGMEDQEELFDPETGKSIGKALVGPQHMLKLVHQVDKKVSVRSGMAALAGELPEKYDNNLIPSGSGKTGGQSIGHNGLYTLLAHGAKCFLGSTEITVRGSKKRNQISSIVRNREQVEVLSFNPVTSALEWKPVVAWQARVARPEELVELRYSAMTKKGRRKGYVTKCTGGHEFYTRKGKVQAGDLKRGDHILVPGTKLSPVHRQLIIGSTLGDGSLSKAETLHSGFRCSHGAPQEEYVRLKHQILKPLTRSSIQRVAKSRGSFSKGPQYRFWTLGHGEISELRAQFYPKGEKVVPDNALAEANEAALAFWILDDADTSVQDGKYRQVRIHTCAFTESDVQKLIQWLSDRWGINSRMFWKKAKSNKRYPCISVFNKNADKLLRLIAPYTPTCLQYKLKLELGGIPKTLVGSRLRELIGHELTESLEPTPVTSVKAYVPKSYEDYIVYNIEVEDNHNYFANGVLVGNSNIREMQTWKSEGPDPETSPGKGWRSQHMQVWNAIQMGEPLPTPQPTFSFQKFTDLLKGAGINVEKQGHQLKILPFTDAQTLAMSSGEIKQPHVLTESKVDASGELKPKRNGLFDPKITGGHGGKGWSHITLPEPMPNPVFEGAIRKLTGLKQKDYDALVFGERALGKDGKFVDLDTPGSVTGGAAIKTILDGIDTGKELMAAEKELASLKVSSKIAHGATTQKLDALVKKVKYLKTLQQLGMKPSEAYVMQHLPVIPPAMRPASIMDGGVSWHDLNGLYKTVGEVIGKMRDPILHSNLTDEGKKDLRRNLYDGLKALTGMDKTTDEGDKGILHLISGGGDSPKTGFFQQTLLKRKQDLTMRSTIIPEPALGIDEIGLPKDKMLSLMKPFVVRKLVEIGAASSPLPAQELIKKKSPLAYRAMELVAQDRPVLIKRDPALHKHSVQAFIPKPVHGNAIQIHPLSTSGFNADFDGDSMSVYVPVSREAVKEAYDMLPSSNLFNEATGKVIYKPTLEAALGLFKLSRVTGDSNKSFTTVADALKAAQSGQLDINKTVIVAGKKTTPGRLLIASALPQGMKDKWLTADPQQVIDGKGLDRLFEELAKNHKTEFGTSANRLKDLGNGAAYGSIAIANPNHQGPYAIAAAEGKGIKREYIPLPTHSLSLNDFSVDTKTRDKFVSEASKQVQKIKSQKLPEAEKDRRIVSVWEDAMKKMTSAHFEKVQDNPTNLALMVAANVKPSKDQYRQMVLAPGILTDAAGQSIPTPVIKSYSEGLDLAGYWTQSHGSRGGTIKKVQEVRDPGYFSKQLMQAAMASAVVTTEDCGTPRGISMHVGSADIHDRILASDFSAKGTLIPKGTTLSPDVIGKIRALDKDATLLVRSTLKCEHEKGVCQKCAGISPSGGPYRIGTNLGVLSAQSLGERSVQLTLKAFHSGGVSTGGSGTVNSFKRVQDLTLLPGKIADSATLAMKSGVIEKVENDSTGTKVWIGGVMHHVGKDRGGQHLSKPLHGVNSSWKTPKVGMHVEAGQPLSDPTRTFINPHDLYKATNSMERVQNFLTNELHGIYKNEGVRRQNVETLVRSMGELTKVRDPGDAAGEVMKGEYRNAQRIRAINKELAKMGKRPIEHSPILKGIDVLPLEIQEDWMAKMMHAKLRNTVIEAAATGAVSDLHGVHPVPGMAYGAEFGLTKKDSLKPRLGHLKNVPDWSY